MPDQILNNFETFIFVFIRILSIFIAIPFLGSRSVPLPLKIGMALLLGIIVTPTIEVTVPLPETLVGFWVGVLREILIGIAIGFTARLIFSAVEMTGQVIGMQMGFAVANVIDPQTSNQLSVVAQFCNLMGILLFFSLNVHLVFISAIKESFEFISPYNFVVTRGVVQGILVMTGNMFRISVKLAAPVMVAILLANIAMGVIARTVPQLNVFVMGFPITIAIGLIILGISIPFILSALTKIYIDLSHDIIDLLKVGG